MQVLFRENIWTRIKNIPRLDSITDSVAKAMSFLKETKKLKNDCLDLVISTNCSTSIFVDVPDAPESPQSSQHK